MSEIREKILKIIYEAIDDINNQEDQTEEIVKSEVTVLMGQGSEIDSLGLVNLIVAIEQEIEDAFDISLTLADERALSQAESPFSNVNSLLSYIEILVKEEMNE
tara:strand:- start:1322 stop:1633 length:312 start_codon:yes stop_codon:yes gene_type:complete